MAAASLPERPLLSGLYHVVPLGRDRVQVCNAGRAVVISGDGLGERGAELLDALDGRTDLAELRRRFPDLIPDLLERLAEKGLLSDGNGVVDEPTGRALAATALAEAVTSPPAEVARRLAASSVAIVGCGAVGGATAVLLAKAGVGRLLLGDDGRVSAADTAVSPVLDAAASHGSRAEAIAAACRRAGSRTAQAVSRPLPEERLRKADLVVIEAAYEEEDDPFCLDEAGAAFAAGRRHIVHGQDGMTAILGPLVAAGGAPCHVCAQTRLLSHVERLIEREAYLRHRARTAPQPDAFVAAHSSVVAGLLAAEILRALSAPATASAGTASTALVVDLAALTVSREEVLPVVGCARCDGAGSQP